MRSTFTIDDKILAEAKESTGIRNTSALLREGLTSLIQREAGRRLAKLGGSQPDLKAPPPQALSTSMILVDTSVWVDHLNDSDPHMAELLERDRVLMHPYVLGEIALGKLRRRNQLLTSLSQLAVAPVVLGPDVISAINAFSLDDKGIGFVDVHILLSAKLGGHSLWTRDKRLTAQAERLGIHYRALQ